MADPSDELARTATAGGGAAGAATAPLGATLGRYRLERELGEGGMGVVHAAFDPDLERRVALKVLRTAHGEEARQRLLREARAMARLTHPNVVTVHEVGSVAGRDYVAMELIDGGTLDQWLKAARRAPREIIEAFGAAGRGLAAAHAAGLVHRDFKPHNVLRRRDGRIAVTDFGLARGVEDDQAFATTVNIKTATAAMTPSSLSGLTATGSVLGTPAYMSPEQWSGGVVGPAADQFAFCVALWEALTGERPFRGATLEQLKSEVQRGPGELDASKLPRRLRKALRRGLDPDPAKRWPSMNALLAAIARADRRPIVALIASGAVLASAGVYLAMSQAPAAPGCEPPARDSALVWPAGDAAALRAAGRGDIAAVLDRDVTAWRSARSRACAAPTGQRIAALTCLDGVLARLDAVHRAVGALPGELHDEDVTALLVAPNTCNAAAPPRLTLRSSPDVAAAFALGLDADRDDTKLAEADVAAFVAKPGLDPCARSIGLLALGDVVAETDVPREHSAVADAVSAAEECGDDRVRADALIDQAPLEREEPHIGPRGRAAIVKASTAVDHVAQPDLVAEIDLLRARTAGEEARWSDAFAAIDKAVAELGERKRTRAQILAVLEGLEIHSKRANLADVEAVRANVATWRPAAVRVHADDLIRKLDRTDAFCEWFLGDPEAAHAKMMQLWKPNKKATMLTQRIDGVVVDRDGHPAAGALVIAGRLLFLDSYGPMPLPGATFGLRVATTDAAGKFEIADAATSGAIVAQLGDLRSIPIALAQHTRLALAPVRRLEGTADLGGRDRTTSFVMLQTADGPGVYRVMMPIKADGTFTIDRAPTGKLQIGIATRNGFDQGSIEMVPLPASAATTKGIQLRFANTARALSVIARSSTSQALDAAQVFVFPGNTSFKSMQELNTRVARGRVRVQYARPVNGESIPQAARGSIRAGDLVAQFTQVPTGDITVCAIGLNGDLADPKFDVKLQAHLNELALHCELARAGADLIVIDTPPQKRFD